MTVFWLLTGFVAAQRLLELAWSRRNAKWLRSHGAIEYGREHYRYAILLHISFLVCLCIEVLTLHRHPAAWWPAPFVLFVLAQALRYRAIVALGPFWNTRVLVIPGSSVKRSGPYRIFRHPNYLAVAAEFLSIPLLFQAYLTLVIFSILNILFLRIRIRIEDAALKANTDLRAVPGI